MKIFNGFMETIKRTSIETKLKIEKKPIILIFANYYLPGYKSGGGLRTIVNMVDRLHHQFDFRIVTTDHDGKEDLTPYENVLIDQWNDIGNAKVFYLSKKNVKAGKFRELILQIKPEAIYLNSFFSIFTILILKLRNLKLIPSINIILAPCGELSDGALFLKSTKKRLYLKYSKVIGLYKNIIWKTSNDQERAEVERLNLPNGKYFVAPDLTPVTIFEEYEQHKKPKKDVGTVKMVFLSRVYPKKNIKWLLENLQGIENNFNLDIYGPIEDADYWNECQNLINNLPQNISVSYKGSIPFENVLNVLFQYHFFIMPTMGENFGHIFLEALASGCPLIISDKTPWNDLENQNIGWDLSLENKKRWKDVINRCIKMDDSEYQNLSQSARDFTVKWLADDNLQEDTKKVLDFSLKY